MKQPNPHGTPAERLQLGPLTDAGRRLAHDLARVAPRLQSADLVPDDARAQFDAGCRLLEQDRADEAVARLERATAIAPRDADAHHRLGQALSWLGREYEAVASLRRAVALAPGLVEALLELGELQLQAGDAAAADADFASAEAATTSEATALYARAWRCWCDGRQDLSETLLRQCRALEPRRARTLEMLGQVLAQAGRFDEADGILREALGGVGPGVGGAAWALATIRPATEADRPLYADALRRLQQDKFCAQDRMLLHFAIAKHHQDLGEYAQAMRHYQRANDLRGRHWPLDRAAVRGQVDGMIGMFPPGSLNADRLAGPDDARPIFILGLPRSGTTLAEQILSCHPQVAAGGEQVFWGFHGQALLQSGSAAPSDAALRAVAARYLSLIDELGGPALRVTDKNPFNFWWIGLIRQALPKARFVLLRRDPLDTCVSLYTTYMSWRNTFFVGNREQLVAWHRETTRLLRHWRAVLPADTLLSLDYEALVQDRERQTRRLVEFCGLPWHAACLRPDANTGHVGTASLWQARQPVYHGSIGRWRRYAPWLGPLAQLMSDEK